MLAHEKFKPPPTPSVFQTHNLLEVRSSQPRPAHDKPSGKVSSYNVPRGTRAEEGKKGEQIICSSPVSSCPSHALSSAEMGWGANGSGEGTYKRNRD